MGSWIRRHRLVTAVGMIAALGLIGVVGFTLVGGFDETTTTRVSGDGVQVVRVALVDRAVGFDITPDIVEVERGTHVVVEVANEAGAATTSPSTAGPEQPCSPPARPSVWTSARSSPMTPATARSETTTSPA
jgi:hypothetical protein